MVAILLLLAANAAEPPSLCGLEELTSPASRVCPRMITYDEEGEEIGSEATGATDGTEVDRERR